jgi:hypothetical protein
MRRIIALVVFASSVHTGISAVAAERANINRRTGLFEPPASDLRKAAERGDRAELSRAATRMGPGRLARLMSDPDRKVVLAALEAAPLLEAGVLLLQPMLPLLASPDDTIRARAVAATAAVFAASDPVRLDDYDVAPEVVTASCQALAQASANEGEQLAARLTAIQGAVDAGPGCLAHLKTDALLASRDPDIRRAAILAMPDGINPKLRASLLAVSKDKDPKVAGAAVAKLCKAGEKRTALPPLHDLVTTDAALAEDVVDIVPCLAASADPSDQKTLTELADKGRPSIREAVKRLRDSRPSHPVAETPSKKP